MRDVVKNISRSTVRPVNRLAGLRHILAEKFPASETKVQGVMSTGLEILDQREGGLRQGSVTEITGSLGASSLILEGLLTILAREKCCAALVDGGSSFNPEDYQGSPLSRLLWVMCANANDAVKSTDLLLRDGNLSMILLDLQMVPTRDLQRIPASTWHRFQRLVEQTNLVFTVFSCRPMIEGATVRIALHNRWNLRAMRQWRRGLVSRLDTQVLVRSTPIFNPQSFSSYPQVKKPSAPLEPAIRKFA